MRWKPTWILLGIAAVLFTFIVLFERRLPDPNTPPPRLLAFKPSEITNIQLRLTNQLILTASRAKPGALWNISFPISYRARDHAIEPLLRALAEVVPHAEISMQELKAGKRTIAEFGLDVPQATLTLQHNGQRIEILFGSKMPVGEGVYAQVLNRSPIYILSAEFVNALPRSYNGWRDLSLLASAGFQMDRIEIRSPGRGFTVDIHPPTQKFLLVKPLEARADPAKLEALLQKLIYAQATGFITDDPRADLEAYGLQPPQAELLFSTNNPYTVQFALQFGNSPTNDPANVYVRRLATTNIVLAPRAVLEALQISHNDVRDLHLVNFAPNAVEAIEVTGDESFTVRRQTNGTWMITEPKAEAADTNAVREWLDLLSRLEGTVEKEVVTDFKTPYGLNPPSRRYLLKGASTNGPGAEQLLSELDLGGVQENKVFARRPDEATVYSLTRAQVARLPRASWQLRSRRVWSFTTNQIHRVTIRHRGQTKTLQRSSNAIWSLVEGAGIVPTVNPVLDDVLSRLGELQVNAWVDKGDTNRYLFGFTETSDRITIELRNGEKPAMLVLEFGRGGISPTGLPYALAVVDEQTWIFEFPPKFFLELPRDLYQPLFPVVP